MDEVFEKNYKKGDEAFLTLIDTYSKGRSDNAVRQMVEQIYKSFSEQFMAGKVDRSAF